MSSSAKKIFTALTLLVGLFFVFHLVHAQVNLGLQYGNAIGLSATDPRIIIGRIIQIFLGLLGIIALGLIIWGGFLWMTAAGNEEKIDQAKRTLISAIIGLAIILAAFGIATFILNSLLSATGIGGGGSNNNNNSGPVAGINGAGVIGECSVQSVYPIPNQQNVAENTAIFITFKQAVDPKTICQTVDAKTGLCCAAFNSDGSCKTLSAVVTGNAQIFKTSDGHSADTDAKLSVMVTPDHKTYTFIPAENLVGSDTNGGIFYSVNLTNDILAESSGKEISIFSGCQGGSSGFSWQFQVSNKIDLTPPQVVSGGVFPPPDNGRDLPNDVLSKLASGTLEVLSNPQIFVAAIGTVQQADAQDKSTPNASIAVDPNAATGAANLKIIVYQNSNGVGFKATLTTSAGVNIDTANFIGNTVTFTGTYPFSITANGTISSGNSWLVDITAAEQPDTLSIGSMIYTFAASAANLPYNQIAVGASPRVTAQNITDALNQLANVSAVRSPDTKCSSPGVCGPLLGNIVTVSAKSAGTAGNNIILAFNSPTKSQALSATTMSGGQDGSNQSDFNVNTAGNEPDQPMNTVIQINFNEPILPSNVVGTSKEVTAIQVINLADGSVVSGNFAIANQYQTVEFTSDKQCGVNGCGEPIYCLPANSHLKVVIHAASLAPCVTPSVNGCSGRSIAGTAYDQCLNNICSDNLGGNYAATAPEVRRYPLANIQSLDGVTDAAFNSLDGDRNTYAEGQAATFSDNPPIYNSTSQICQNDFTQIINAVIAARIAQNKVLGDITGPDAGTYKYWTDGGCAALGAAGCLNLMNAEMKDIGLSGAVKDGSGNPFIFDENEDEPTHGACRQDTISSVVCGTASIPTFYCDNGDNYSWSFYVSDQMDVSAPVVLSTSPAQGGTPLVDQGVSINFSKLMMATTLITGSTIINNGQTTVSHKNINLWNSASNPVGYWIQTQTNYDNGVPNTTNAIIEHGDFGESSGYSAQAGSGVRDIHENCFKPSGDCPGVSESMPSCCPDASGKLVPTATLDANGDCP